MAIPNIILNVRLPRAGKGVTDHDKHKFLRQAGMATMDLGQRFVQQNFNHQQATNSCQRPQVPWMQQSLLLNEFVPTITIHRTLQGPSCEASRRRQVERTVQSQVVEILEGCFRPFRDGIDVSTVDIVGKFRTRSEHSLPPPWFE